MCVCTLIDRHGQKTQQFVAQFLAIVASVIDSKHSDASFLPFMIVWPPFKHTQEPISRELAILVPTTMATTDIQTNHITKAIYNIVMSFFSLRDHGARRKKIDDSEDNVLKCMC